MLPGEREIWTGFGDIWNAEFIKTHLYCLAKDLESRRTKVDVSATLNRQYNFLDAMQELQRRLHAGELTAEFCDEEGCFTCIEKDGWGGNDALNILLNGTGDMRDGFVRHFLLSESAVRDLAKALKGEPRAPDFLPRSEPAKSSKVSAQAPRTDLRKAEDIFREWREGQPDGRIPTYDEDVAYMKTFNISRDRVRELRRPCPKLRQGQSPRRQSRE
jgi:ribosomal protein S14